MSVGATGRSPSGDAGEPKGRRQVVKFSFFRVDPAWRALPAAEREAHKAAFAEAVERFADRLQVRSYSVVGMRGDADFLLWQIGDHLDDIQALHTALLGTPMGACLTLPYSYLAMTRRSVYVSGEEAAERTTLRPADSRNFFVYPFVKTREWYQLPLEERQAMMNEHIRVGRKYPSVKLNTTYSFGLDDQEFVVSFETDEPADFLDLVMELREAKTSIYTLRDTPIFTCIALPLLETLDTLAASTQTPVAQGWGTVPQSADPEVSKDEPAWTRVAVLADLPPGASKAVYYEGEQVALVHTTTGIFAVANRCSHANGPLADGAAEGTTVTCPYHSAQFDLATGVPLCGPASRPIPTYDVRVEDGAIYLVAGARAPAFEHPA
jgi:chlorite dismutase